MGVNLSGNVPSTPGAPGGILQQIFDGIAGADGIGQMLADGLVGIIGMTADALFGPGPGDPIVRIADGMTDLNERVELMDDVSGYAGTILVDNHRVGTGGSWKVIPFSGKYGPEKNATLDVASHRLYLSEGSWSAHFTISTGSGIGISGIGHGLRAQVYDETGAAVITRRFDWQTGTATWDQHFAMPIIAPVSGWSVELAYRHSGGWWPLLGGTEKTLLWVERKNMDTENHEVIVPGEGGDIT